MANNVHLDAATDAARAVLSTSTRSLRTAGYAALADRIIHQATHCEPTPVVVFVGESGRGKSSLVEVLAPALDGRPVDSAGQQGLYRLAVPPREGEPDLVWIYADGTRSEIELQDMDPVGFQFKAASQLGEVILLDAPSTGGLTGSQSQLNIKLLEGASVVVFVTDAGAVLSTAELAYLQQCADQVERVGMVVTKTDLYPGSWQNVVAGNAALLRAWIPRLSDSFVVGVSTMTMRAARLTPDPEMKSTLLEASAMPQLTQKVKQELAKADSSGLANALRLAQSGLEAHQKTLLARLAALKGPAVTQQSIMAEQKRLSELKDQQQRWTLDLDRDLSGLRASLLAETRRKLERWEAEWREKVKTTKSLRDAKITEKITREIFAQLQMLRSDIVEGAEEQFQGLIERLFHDVSVPTALEEILEGRAEPQYDHKLDNESPTPSFDPTMVMTLVMGSSMGSTLSGLLGGAGLFGTAVTVSALAPPLAILGAGGWFVANKLYRHNLQERNRFLSEIPRLAQAERAVISEHLDDRLRALKPEIVVAYRTELQASLTHLQQLLHQTMEHENLSAQSTHKHIEDLRRELAIVQKQILAIEDALARLKDVDSAQQLPPTGR
ncbi:Rab family GTPase [Arthrobacter sp. MDT2-16]